MDSNEARLQQSQFVRRRSNEILRLTSIQGSDGNEEDNHDTADSLQRHASMIVSQPIPEEEQSSSDTSVGIEFPSSTMDQQPSSHLGAPAIDYDDGVSCAKIVVGQAAEYDETIKKRASLASSMHSRGSMVPDEDNSEAVPSIQQEQQQVGTLLPPPRQTSQQDSAVVPALTTLLSSGHGGATTPGAQRVRGMMVVHVRDDLSNEEEVTVATANTTGESGRSSDDGIRNITAVPPNTPRPPVLTSSITATAVTRDDLEQEVRDRLMAEAVMAHVVVDAGSTSTTDGGDRNRDIPTTSTRRFRSNSVVPLPEGSPDGLAKQSTSSTLGARRCSLLRWVILLCAMVLAGAVGGVVLGMRLTPSRNDDILNDEDTPNDSQDNELPPVDDDADTVNNRTAIDLQALLKPLSPLVTKSGTHQRAAFEWLVGNNKTVEDDHIIETYALVTLYYATSGESWTHAEHWLDPTVSVCTWYPGELCQEQETDDDGNDGDSDATESPSQGEQTESPTSAPSDSTENPTASPSVENTQESTSKPSPAPTEGPTPEPTIVPTSVPTGSPTSSPRRHPTRAPTSPTASPTGRPSPEPTESEDDDFDHPVPTPSPEEEEEDDDDDDDNNKKEEESKQNGSDKRENDDSDEEDSDDEEDKKNVSIAYYDHDNDRPEEEEDTSSEDDDDKRESYQHRQLGEVKSNDSHLSIKQVLLSRNHLQGTLPPEIGLLSKLKELDVSGNPLLTGTIPSEVGNWVDLEIMLASDVSFTGTFPSEMALWKSLEALDMAGVTTMSGGYWPEFVWTLDKIQVINLSGMGLHGSLPPATVKGPKEVYLSANRLTGSIPQLNFGDEIEEHAWVQLQVLDLRHNSLTGSVPSSLAYNWQRDLKTLRLEGNELEGLVENSICEAFEVSVSLTMGDVGGGHTHVFSTDCSNLDEIECPCCTLCCFDGLDCTPTTSTNSGRTRQLRGALSPGPTNFQVP